MNLSSSFVGALVAIGPLSLLSELPGAGLVGTPLVFPKRAISSLAAVGG
jgi:hypothetical protein